MILAIEGIVLCLLFTLAVYKMSRDPIKTLYNYPPAIQERVKSLEDMVNENVSSGAAAQSDEFLEKFSALEAQMDEKSAVINELREAKNALEAEYKEKINQMEKDFAVTKSDLEEQLRQRDTRISEIDALIDMFVDQINELNAKRDSAAATQAAAEEDEDEEETEEAEEAEETEESEEETVDEETEEDDGDDSDE